MEKPIKNQWFLAIKDRGEELINTSGLKELTPPKGTYHADPMLFDYKGKTYLFYEDYDYVKGVISCVELNDPDVKTHKKILERPYHLSFPFVFEDEGKVYMIPESGANNGIELYEAIEFPDKWKRVRVMIEGPAPADSVLYRNEGGYWLFSTIGGDDVLYVFSSKSLHGEWSLHYRGVQRHSRGAGSVFEYKGKLLRPVQDSTKIYGGAIIFKEIQLEPTYKELGVFSRIEPTWQEGLIGTHTFTFNDKYVVVDGKRRI